MINYYIPKEIDALYVSNEYNKRYITGFTGSASEVIITANKTYLITDGRYTLQARDEVDAQVEIIIIENSSGYFAELIALINKLEIVKLGIEGEEVSVSQLQSLQANLPQIEFVAYGPEIAELRKIKTDREIELIKQACQITDKAFTDLQGYIKPGMTERELFAYLEYRQLVHGAEKSSFDMIVCSGVNASKPHASPTDRIVEEGDIITFDFGAIYQGYCSDMTRTFFVGQPKDQKLVEIYNVVKEAYLQAVEVCVAGMKTADVDKVARDYIESCGYGEYFIHGLGHSLGLEVHENPRFRAQDQEILQAGMIMTVEPGIYIDGLGGCRIENDILIKADGYEVLNQSPLIFSVDV